MISVGEDVCGELEPYALLVGMQDGVASIKIELPYNPPTPLLNICLKELRAETQIGI